MKFNFRKIIDKIVDPEGLLILVYISNFTEQVRFSDNIINTLQYLSMGVIIRDITKYVFLNAMDNPIYSFKKLQFYL